MNLILKAASKRQIKKRIATLVALVQLQIMKISLPIHIHEESNKQSLHCNKLITIKSISGLTKWCLWNESKKKRTKSVFIPNGGKCERCSKVVHAAKSNLKKAKNHNILKRANCWAEESEKSEAIILASLFSLKRKNNALRSATIVARMNTNENNSGSSKKRANYKQCELNS